MMRIKWIFLIFFVFSYAYADNQNVGNWAQQALMETLSVSYDDPPSKFEAIQKNYFPSAWESIEQFMSKGRAAIDEKKLSLHPEPLTLPITTESNDCGFSPCWQVNQSFNIPELSLKVNFSLRIVQGNLMKNSTSPFLIQSLYMAVYNY